jgi:hypothetical protein
MKHTLTILFAIMLCGAKAQTPVDTAKALTGDEVIKESYPEDRWRQVRYSLYSVEIPLQNHVTALLFMIRKTNFLLI